jgi:S-methylmethionine-dependent homocysteine/selenocysteine methylase
MSEGRLTSLLERQRPVLLDGAMGTELQRRGVDVGLPLWSALALRSAPDVVLQIHRDYLVAGADIITTNTFRTTSRTFRRAGVTDHSADLTRLAVMLARKAAGEVHDRPVLVAGSMAPLEDCYRPDRVPPEDQLAAEHAAHAQQLAKGGVDVLLLETMGTIREARAACCAAAATGKEVVVSFLCTPEGDLYGGESIIDAVHALGALGVTAFSLNCISPYFLQPALSALLTATTLPCAVYANVGRAGEEHGGTLMQDVTVEEYTRFVQTWVRQGVAIVGGCCGTTPSYLEAVKKSLAATQPG